MSAPRADDARPEPGFYEAALMAGALDTAAEPVDDLSDVIGDLRRRLREQLYERPDDVQLILRSSNALSRAATTRQGMSMQAKRRLAGNMDRLMEEVHDLMRYPPPRNDEEQRAMLARMREEPSPREIAPDPNAAP